MRSLRRGFLISPLFLVVVYVSLSSPESTPTFTLQSAIQYALQNNVDLRVAQNRRIAAEAEVRTQSQFSNPDFVGEWTRSQPNYFVGAGYLFELGGKRRTRIGIATNEAKVAAMDLESAERDLRHDVRVGFYEVLQAQAKERDVTISRNLAKRLLDITNSRFEAGDVPRLDVLQAQLELKRRESEVAQAENESKSAIVRFNLLLNRNPQDPLTASGTLEDTSSAPSLESLLANAESQRPEIRSAQAQVLAQQGRLSLEQKGRIPDLQLEAGAEIHDAEHQYGWRTNLSFELPLLNQKQGQIAGASATLESLKFEEESQKRKVRSEVTESFFLYQTTSFRVQNFTKDLLPATKELEDLSEESYHEGKSSLVSTFDAQRNTLQVRLEYLDALMDYQKAVADLEKTSVTELP